MPKITRLVFAFVAVLAAGLFSGSEAEAAKVNVTIAAGGGDAPGRLESTGEIST